MNHSPPMARFIQQRIIFHKNRDPHRRFVLPCRPRPYYVTTILINPVNCSGQSDTGVPSHSICKDLPGVA